MIITCYLGGDAGGDRGSEALIGGGFEGEEVGGPRVETHKQVMGLVPQLEHPSPLGCQISAGVQRAQGLVGNLETVWHISALLCLMDFTIVQFGSVQMMTFWPS